MLRLWVRSKSSAKMVKVQSAQKVDRLRSIDGKKLATIRAVLFLRKRRLKKVKAFINILIADMMSFSQ